MVWAEVFAAVLPTAMAEQQLAEWQKVAEANKEF